MANLAASVSLLLATWRQHTVLRGIRDGVPYTDSQLERVDLMYGVSGLALVVTFLVGAVAFVRWFHRAYKNQAVVGRTRYRTGWAIAAWFVPILNLWRPYRIGRELVAAVPGSGRAGAPTLLGLWWVAVLTSGIMDRVVARRDDGTLDAAIAGASLELVSTTIWIIAGMALLWIITVVTDAQDVRPAVLRWPDTP